MVNVLLGFHFAIEMYIMYNFSTVIAILTLLMFVLFCFVLFFFRLPTKQWKRQEEQFLNWGKK